MKHTFLIGTHRSGTTWLGSLLGMLPRTAYWVEPRQVWSYKNWRKKDDRLTAEDATPAISRHIQKRFISFADSLEADHFVEKTPSNCLRVGFIDRIFPDGKFILLLRDGRAVLRSTDEIQVGGAGWDRIRQRIRETSIRELPAYLDRLPWLWRKVLGKRLDFWGVRPPGWQEWGQDFSPMQIIAKQWSDSILEATASVERLPSSRILEIRYEELVMDPETQLRQVLDFLDIQNGDHLITAALASRRIESISKWRKQLPQETLESVRPIIEPTLHKIGYHW